MASAIPITDTRTETCARALLFNWIAIFGVPLHLTSDMGAQFTSEIWNVLTAHLGIKTHHTTAYHPQTNGLVELLHRTMKAALKAKQNWMDELPWVLLGIRTAPKEDLYASSAELVHGYPLTVPGDYVKTNDDQPPLSQALSQLRETVSKLLPTPTYPSQHNKSFAASFCNLALFLSAKVVPNHLCRGHTKALSVSSNTAPRLSNSKRGIVRTSYH